MATGFSTIQRNTVNKDPGYKTLFERVTAATGGEKKSLSWYRNAVKAEASKYKKNFSKYILEEKRDRDFFSPPVFAFTLSKSVLYPGSLFTVLRWTDANPVAIVILLSDLR